MKARGRPTKPADARRSTMVNTRVTASEADRLYQIARAKGRNLSDLTRGYYSRLLNERRK